MVQVTERAKWDAWNAKKGTKTSYLREFPNPIGTDQATAKEDYIKLVDQFKPQYA